MYELKPCPFCGGKSIMFDIGSYWPKIYYRVITVCNCAIQGRFYDTQKEAADAWNRREMMDGEN